VVAVLLLLLSSLYTVNKVPGYNIGGDSELATSGPENSSEKEMFYHHHHHYMVFLEWPKQQRHH